MHGLDPMVNSLVPLLDELIISYFWNSVYMCVHMENEALKKSAI